MRVHVAFTPSEAATASLGIVVDVVRATSSIAQALASGYRRVLCCAEVEQARALRASLEDAVVGGERDAIRIEGFDLGASPRGLPEPCAGRIVAALGDGERTDAAIAASLLAQAFPRALDGLNARTYGPPGLEADIEWCARESVLDVVPRLARIVDRAAEVVG